jgi:hypothetical protein
VLNDDAVREKTPDGATPPEAETPTPKSQPRISIVGLHAAAPELLDVALRVVELCNMVKELPDAYGELRFKAVTTGFAAQQTLDKARRFS